MERETLGIACNDESLIMTVDNSSISAVSIQPIAIKSIPRTFQLRETLNKHQNEQNSQPSGI